jgi:hypothetical protein
MVQLCESFDLEAVAGSDGRRLGNHCASGAVGDFSLEAEKISLIKFCNSTKTFSPPANSPTSISNQAFQREPKSAKPAPQAYQMSLLDLGSMNRQSSPTLYPYPSDYCIHNRRNQDELSSSGF